MLDQPKRLRGGFSGVLRPQQTAVSASSARSLVRLVARASGFFLPSFLHRNAPCFPVLHWTSWLLDPPGPAFVGSGLVFFCPTLGFQKVKDFLWVLLGVIILFVRKGGEGVLGPMTWRDPLLVVLARRCLSPYPNPSPAMRASFGFEPISTVYFVITYGILLNKLPPISALQSLRALRTRDTGISFYQSQLLARGEARPVRIFLHVEYPTT